MYVLDLSLAFSQTQGRGHRRLARPLMDSVLASISKPSISAGVGLVYKLDPIRVEVNFGVPLVASKSDGVRKGFQVGIGVDFL